MTLNKKNLFIAFLLSVLLFPQLPPVFGRSEIHINLYASIFALIILFKYSITKKKNIILPLIYFCTLQSFLILTYFGGIDSLLSVYQLPSLFRPIMLLIITLGFLALMSDYKTIYLSSISISKFMTILVFLYSILEVFFFNVFSPIFHTLYRLSDKSNIDGIAVSFFTLPYYAAYILSIFLIFLICNYNDRKNIKNTLYIVICILSIILTQSKMGVALCLITLFLFSFLNSKILTKLLVLFLFSIILLLLYIYLLDIVSYLKEYVGGHFANTLYLMLTDPAHSGNLMERIKDITSTYSIIEKNNILIGAGIGKGTTIETWIASIMYRYGFLGLVFFILFYLFIGYSCWKSSMKEKENLYRQRLLLTCSVWSLSLFASQLSGLMIEVSKCAIISCFMLALSSFCLSKPKTSYSL